MSSIKIKIGKCIDPECGPNSQDQPLTAKRCQLHYWKHRAEVKKADKKQKLRSQPLKDLPVSGAISLVVWFEEQMKQIPLCCEECGTKFVFFASWTKKAVIAHILPKRNFKSVQTHPLNRCFLCIHCHQDYDNRGSQHVVKMKVFEKMKQVVQEELIPVIPNQELKYLPEYFL